MRRFIPVIGLLLLTGCGTLPAGYVGVKTQFGATTGETVQPGLYFLNPFTQAVQRMNVQTQAYAVEAAAATHDLQNVTTHVTLNYRLDPAKVIYVYSNLGPTYEAKIISPSVQEAVKSVTAHYEATELITNREAVRTEIVRTLAGRLEQHGILVDQLSVTQFAFDKEFADAIEQKVVSTQNALKAQNDLNVVKMEAQQRIAQAQGEAEAIKIQAEAIEHQGGAAYVNLKAIEKWNGVLPTWMSGSGSVPFVNIK